MEGDHGYLSYLISSQGLISQCFAVSHTQERDPIFKLLAGLDNDFFCSFCKKPDTIATGLYMADQIIVLVEEEKTSGTNGIHTNKSLNDVNVAELVASLLK